MLAVTRRVTVSNDELPRSKDMVEQRRPPASTPLRALRAAASAAGVDPVGRRR